MPSEGIVPKRLTRLHVLLLAVGFTYLTPQWAVGQAARQDDATKVNPGGYEEFHSPMILDTVFVAADRQRWYPRRDAWIGSDEYRGLRKFRRDKVSILGLQMNGREGSGGLAEIAFRIALLNPDENQDKKVVLLLQAVNGEEVGGRFELEPIKVEEGQTVSGRFTWELPLATLKTDPLTTLRITMTTWDY